MTFVFCEFYYKFKIIITMPGKIAGSTLQTERYWELLLRAICKIIAVVTIIFLYLKCMV